MWKQKKFYFIIFFLLAAVFSINRFMSKREIPVLNYHEINNTNHTVLALSTQEFTTQMKYLNDNGYTTITPDQLFNYLQNGVPLPPNPVLITFDDGYEDNYTNAYPILKQYHLQAAIFLISHYIGYNNYLSWQDINKMRDTITFEGHTFNHPYLNKINNDNELQKQLLDSKLDLEKHLGYHIDCLAYPYGAYNQHVISLLKKDGYRAAFTVNLGDDAKRDDMYQLNRIPVFQAYSHTFIRFWLDLHFPYFMRVAANTHLNFPI
ncbi:polysaccharide deacetylase family protein [Pectinatus frisingensis]|uniref:polysaccharide deacetylase family protein n=1 Tax=Pectinatus frisingensis TaxID=865 RepID=UPI0018C46878|nr:polysaccharide deacetylase family protein [Pectinatus frisingensis]